MSEKSELTTIYKECGATLEVNQHMVAQLKSGCKTLKGFSLKKPEEVKKSKKK